MNRQDFTGLLDAAHASIRALNTTKGKDYAGDEDALSNFKRSAARLNLTPEQIWGVYAAKHWDAIMSYCAHGQVESEPVEGRILDLVLYAYLLLGLVKEREGTSTYDRHPT